MLDPAAIPQALRDAPHWIVWRSVPQPGGKKPRKLPINPATLKAASTTQPADWSDFATALATLNANPDLAGLGFVFTRPDAGGIGITGIDLDDCIDADGNIHPEAQRILDGFTATYAEISPSGRGVKIFAIGRKPPTVTSCKRLAVAGCSQIEVYDHDRFFTVTGNGWEHSSELADCQAAIDALCAMLWPAKPTPATPAAPTSQSVRSRVPMEQRYEKYLAKLPDAIAGQDGSGRTMEYACSGFRFAATPATPDGLTEDQIWTILCEINQTKCKPPWTEKELRHKFDSARKLVDEAGERGKLAAVTRTAMQPPPGVTQPSTPIPHAPDIIPLGERDPDGHLVLSPKRTLPTAQAYVKQFHDHADGRTIQTYGNQIFIWQGNCYRLIEHATVRNRLQLWLHEAKRYQYDLKTQEFKLVPFESNTSTIRGALDSITDHTHLPNTTTPPAWLTYSADDPSPHELLVGRTQTLHIPSGTVIPATPNLFVTAALDFDYVVDAPPPNNWLSFLAQLWPDDPESIEALQDWFGYCLTQDTRQQKIFFIVGPKRSGKGTIGRILAALIGRTNVVNPTPLSLADRFGLQPLIGKSLAIMGDARFDSDNITTIVERLLTISGEDAITIPRRYIEDLTVRLTTRFMLLSNDLPRFRDSSNALTGRFIITRLTRSFFGEEDLGLEAKLLAELPGILAWALDGWKRLQSRGKFVMPASSQDAMDSMEDLSSPVSAFVRDACTLESNEIVRKDDLYQAWRTWCGTQGMTMITTANVFFRDLKSAFPMIAIKRNHDTGRFCEGVSIK